MPSIRYTRIEITPEAYRSLEAEAILQGKTLKKLASELILKGVSKKALDFVRVPPPSVPMPMLADEAARAIEKIGATGIHINDQTLQTVGEILLANGYQGAMLHVAQHTASMERDELHRVLAIFSQYNLSPEVAANLIHNLNEIESGNWK